MVGGCHENVEVKRRTKEREKWKEVSYNVQYSKANKHDICKWNVRVVSRQSYLILPAYLFRYGSIMKNASRSIFTIALRIKIKHFTRVVELPFEFAEWKKWKNVYEVLLCFIKYEWWALTSLEDLRWCCTRFQCSHPWQRRRGRPYQWHILEHLR